MQDDRKYKNTLRKLKLKAGQEGYCFKELTLEKYVIL